MRRARRAKQKQTQFPPVVAHQNVVSGHSPLANSVPGGSRADSATKKSKAVCNGRKAVRNNAGASSVCELSAPRSPNSQLQTLLERLHARVTSDITTRSAVPGFVALQKGIKALSPFTADAAKVNLHFIRTCIL
jgi:hypothetical protein